MVQVLEEDALSCRTATFPAASPFPEMLQEGEAGPCRPVLATVNSNFSWNLSWRLELSQAGDLAGLGSSSCC